METKTLFKGDTIQLLPYDGSHWEILAQWFYDEDYKGMFRQFPRMLTETDFKQYNQTISGEAFLIYSLETNDVIGIIQISSTNKKNKAGYLGLLIDKKYQSKRIPTETMIIFMDYLFNRQGYNKIIVEILESDESLRKTLMSTGFYKEGKLIQECFMDGKFQNELRFSMTAYYFNKNKSKALKEYKQWVDSSVRPSN